MSQPRSPSLTDMPIPKGNTANIMRTLYKSMIGAKQDSMSSKEIDRAVVLNAHTARTGKVILASNPKQHSELLENIDLVKQKLAASKLSYPGTGRDLDKLAADVTRISDAYAQIKQRLRNLGNDQIEAVREAIKTGSPITHIVEDYERKQKQIAIEAATLQKEIETTRASLKAELQSGINALPPGEQIKLKPLLTAAETRTKPEEPKAPYRME
jgi:septation ring formation regulator EzrA